MQQWLCYCLQMARQLRIEYPGAVYHVTARGNAQQDIYATAADRRQFLDILALTVKRHNWLCHAYCLMDNHYHLLIETLDPNLSRGMRHLNGVYTQRFNRLHSRVGHVFQGRFKSILVEKQSYLLELCRYIVLNPVAAKMVKHPEDYEWSSYRFTAHSIKKPEFLSVDWVLGQFSTQKLAALKGYRDFVAEGMFNPPEKPWKNLVGQIFLGGNDFVSGIQELLSEKKQIKEIPKSQRYSGRPFLPDLFASQDIKNKQERNKLIFSAYFLYGYSMKEIGDCLGVHYSTVSRILKASEV